MSEPILTLTDVAAEKVKSVRAEQELDDVALRVRAVPDGPAAFQYSLQFVEAKERTDDDVAVDHDGVLMLVDKRSAENLRGASIDFVESLEFSGFRFDNPNKPPLLDEPIVAAVQKLLDEEINPGIAAHGGNVRMVDYKDGDVYLRFGGGCHGCSQVDLTLKQGVEARIREQVPDVGDIIDLTDHTTGENPYYS